MPIQTESTYDVKIGLTTVDTIGLSDTIDNYTWDEIKDYNYVGSWTECYRQMSHRSPSNTTYIGYASTVGDCPFACEWRPGYTSFDVTGYGTTLYNFDTTHGIYRKLMLLHDSTENYPNVITNGNRNNFKIITEFDAPKYTLEYDDVNMIDSTFYSLYNNLSHTSLKYHTHLGQNNDDDSAILLSFRPYFIIEFESTYYCLRADIISYHTMSASWLNNSSLSLAYGDIADVTQTNAKSAGICESMENWFTDTALTSSTPVPFIQSVTGNNVFYCSQDKYIMRLEFGVNNNGFIIDYGFKAEDDLLLFIAGTYGIHFIVDGTIYKPIIEENFVTGYTDQLDTPSDLDNYSDTDHDMPVTPPEPTPPPSPGDDEVDMPLYASSYGAGLTHYYVFTKDSGVLQQISDAMSTWDLQNTGKDLFRNLISCKLVRVGAVPAENSTFVIYGEELQYQGDAITIQAVTGNPTLDLGEYTIDRFYNDFRDYEPFTKVEMFVPFCGWVPLPSHVVGNKVSGTLIIDIINATCKAVIKCSKTVVAEAAGVCGLDVPFVAENVGMKMAGIASAMTTYGKSASGAAAAIAAGAAGTAVGGTTGAAIAGIAASGKIIEGVGAAAQLYAQCNANYTEICGKTGDGCNIGGLDSVYIKVQRPNYKKLGFSAPLYVPDGFAHSSGFMALKQKKISECTGYIECGNVDTSGISGATERERSIIKAYLESGVIVNHVEP